MFYLFKHMIYLPPQNLQKYNFLSKQKIYLV